MVLLQLLASVVAEDPTKQAWLLSAGILPIMERLVLHADAGLDPESFVAKYSSSNAGSSSSSSEDASGGEDGGSSSGLSLSARIGRGLWGWGSSSSADAAAAGDHDSRLDSKLANDTSSSNTEVSRNSTDSTGLTGVQLRQQDTAAASAVPTGFQQPLLLGLVSGEDLGGLRGSSSTEQHAAAEDIAVDAGAADQQQQRTHQQHQLRLPVRFECEFGCELQSDVSSWRDTETDTGGSSNPSNGSSNGAALRALLASGGPLAKFKAAALGTTSSSGSGTAAAASHDGSSSSSYVEDNSPAQQQQQKPAKPQQQAIPGAMLIEFAQGAASWDLNPTNTPDPAADAATAITAAAEEHPSWIDGEGLGFLCLQRQVARLLGMLALQPAAAGQLAGAAQELPGGAVGVLGLLGPELNPIRAGSRPQTQALLLQHGRQRSSSSSIRSGSSSGPSSSSSSWLPWLLAAAASDDCLLSSYAVVALLHLESAAAHHQHELRMQQRRYRHNFLQQQLGMLGPDSSSSSSSRDVGGAVGLGNRWRQRIAQELQELQSAEDFAAFLEDLWPFNISGSATGSSSSSGGSGSDGVWRPPMYFPDGIHLLNPTDSHHWGLLQAPKITLLESLSAAATAAASAAVAAAASDLSQFDIDASDAAALDPAAAAAAAAAAATAAASALGADTSQLHHINNASIPGSSSSSSSSTGSDSSSTAVRGSTVIGQGGSSSSSGSSSELGFLQPAVVWLAQKLVKFAEIKEEQVVQEQQRQAHAASQEGSNPAAPLSTFAAVQALLSGNSSSSSSASCTSAAGPAALSEQQQQQQQQQQQHFPAEPEFDVVFIHGIRGGPFVTWRKGGTHRHSAADISSSSTDTASSPSAAATSASSSSKGRSSIPLTPSAAMSAHKNHMTRADCWPASWLAADLPGARLLSVEYKVMLRFGNCATSNQ
jgi:hypothetical protein